MTEQFKIFEADLTGTDQGNPYVDIWLKACFQNDSEKIEVNDFIAVMVITRFVLCLLNQAHGLPLHSPMTPF